MPNLFFMCHKKKFMFVSVSKNACTTLKALIYEIEMEKKIAKSDLETIHRYWGFREDGRHLISLENKQDLNKYQDYLRFCVFRDPVERFLSTYRSLVMDKCARHPFYEGHKIKGMALDGFLDFAEKVLRLDNPLEMDEHLRPQRNCYHPDDFHFIVPMERLDGFLLEKFGIVNPFALNKSRNEEIRPSEDHLNRIRNLYQDDYQIIPNY
jgi:hypothetical protein